MGTWPTMRPIIKFFNYINRAGSRGVDIVDQGGNWANRGSEVKKFERAGQALPDNRASLPAHHSSSL